MSSKDGLSEEAKCEDLVKVIIGDDPDKFFQVGSQLPQSEKEELIEFLKRNMDVFAWDAYEAPGVDPEFICHHLNVNPTITPRINSLAGRLRSMQKRSDRKYRS